ncbi:carbohydrate-binding module family 50 protein [Peniophora sp. CONT]|nr:carbohydrate-binding module family 50 protein [Peniophora sp. CONT]
MKLLQCSTMGRLTTSVALIAPFLFSIVRPTLAQDQETFNVFSNASDIYPLPSSSECADALATSLSCPPTLSFAIPSSSNPLSNLTSSDLSELCTASCFASLMTAINSVDTACAGWPYILGDTSYIASLPFRYLAYNWNLTCITDGPNYCVNIAQSNPSTTEPDGPEPSSVLCASCSLNALRIQMSSPFGWDANYVDDWQTTQTECGVSYGDAVPLSLVLDTDIAAASNATSYNVTATPTLKPASSANCAYGTLTVKSGDTCESIATANNLSHDQLVAINGLDLNCTKLPAPGGKICSPGSCTLHTVQSSDTCVGLYTANDITWTQLLAWNPQLDSMCSNLAMQIGKTICISAPGGSYIPATTVPQVSGTPTALAIPTGAVAPGSDRTICGGWYEAVAGDTCPQVGHLITNDTFYELNPLVNEDCSNLLAGFEYCIAVFGNVTSTSTFPGPTTTGASLVPVFGGDFPQGVGYVMASPNMTIVPVTATGTTTYASTSTPSPTVAPGTVVDGCLQYYTVQAGDSCLGIETVYGITDNEFRIWNPEIDANCGNIQVGLAYCVFGPYVQYTPTTGSSPPQTSTATSATPTSTSAPLPTNIATGTITTGCTTYYTIQSGDGCASIESTYSITLSEFITWNPEVNAQCTNIQLGLAYCVAGPAPTSSPTLPGTLAGCSAYYTVQSGDTCAVMESNFGVSLDQIRQWNTEVDANCDNIQIGYGYCMAGPSVGSGSLLPSGGCTDYYTVQPGDSCTVIETNKGISLDQFLTWNPEVNSQCSNIDAGVQYCVAGPATTATTASTSPTSTSAAAAPTGSGTITPGQGCTQYYTVVSGDYCGLIDSNFGITIAQFIKWNPEIDADCTNLELGVQYCVAGP